MSASTATFTILGADGFIGGALVAWLESEERVVHAITRAALPALLASRRPAGHVIDCIGLGGDVQERPLELAEAHVGLVARCLAQLRFESFLLLSSTRVYGQDGAAHEDAVLSATPADPSGLYEVTKLAGEALCLADPCRTTRVARLPDVYGIRMPAWTFLGRLLREGRANGSVVFRESAVSSRDYVSVAAVVRLLTLIATAGRSRIYNVASGHNTSHAEIAECLYTIAGWHTEFAPSAPVVRQPPIDTTRLETEFGSATSNLLGDLPGLLASAWKGQDRDQQGLPAA